jgi:hypothetical protein
MVDEISRWAPDRTPAQPKVGPKVAMPTGANTNPYGPAADISRAPSQYSAVRKQLDASGLNDGALTAIEAGYPGIDKQRSGGGSY